MAVLTTRVQQFSHFFFFFSTTSEKLFIHYKASVTVQPIKACPVKPRVLCPVRSRFLSSWEIPSLRVAVDA